MAFTFIFLIFLYGILFLPGYILTGISLHSIANRRGIERPWMAWVPMMQLYTLGCISDQYQAIVLGKQKNKRAIMLLLVLALLIAFSAMHMEVLSAAAEESLLPFLVIFVPAWCAGAALVVISFLALYDLYASCDPKHATVFLIFSILFSVTRPFFLLACRKKDLGFPL